MRFVSVRKRLHFGMGPESGSASLSRSCDESREELLERLDVHPLLEHLQFLVKFPTDLDRCGHGDHSNGDGAIIRIASSHDVTGPPACRTVDTTVVDRRFAAAAVIISTTVQQGLSSPPLRPLPNA